MSAAKNINNLNPHLVANKVSNINFSYLYHLGIRKLIFDCEIHMVERYKLEANVGRLSRELRECRGEHDVLPPHYYNHYHHHHDDCHEDYYEHEG